MLKTYGNGCILDKEDTRDYELDHILGAGEPFDWEKGYDIEEEIGKKLPVKDQNGSYSCVGQATASLAYILNYFDAQTQFYKQNIPEMSAKSVYSQISIGYGKGASIRSAMALLCDYGINTEEEVPSYLNSKPPKEDFVIDQSWKDDILKESAQKFIGKEFRTLRAKDSIDLMAQAIRDNRAVVFGVNGCNNGTWRKVFPKPGEKEWGHALLGGKAKMINGKKYIGVLNSWGTKTGENGWQWLGEEWFKDDYVFNPWFYIDAPTKWYVKLIDKNGKPRKLPSYMFKAINYLITKRGYKYA